MFVKLKLGRGGQRNEEIVQDVFTHSVYTTCSEFVSPFKSPTKDYIRETSEKKATTTVLSPSLLLEEEDEKIQPTVKRFAVIYVVVEK